MNKFKALGKTISLSLVLTLLLAVSVGTSVFAGTDTDPDTAQTIVEVQPSNAGEGTPVIQPAYNKYHTLQLSTTSWTTVYSDTPLFNCALKGASSTTNPGTMLVRITLNDKNNTTHTIKLDNSTLSYRDLCLLPSLTKYTVEVKAETKAGTYSMQFNDGWLVGG